jgi:ATP-dependent Clp protease ATP-binding subunit ClpC
MIGPRPEARDADDLPFTEAARRLLSSARAESDRLRHEYIGTEHVVLALAQDADTNAVLTRLGVDREQVRASLDSIVRPGQATLPHGAERPYTSKTQQAFAFAAECARSHGHTGVGVEHLVLGLLRQRVNLGAGVLQQHGLTVEQAAAEVEKGGGGESTEL